MALVETGYTATSLDAETATEQVKTIGLVAPTLYNYMDLNPVVLQITEAIIRQPLTVVHHPSMLPAAFPQITEIEADAAMMALSNAFPRQPTCPMPKANRTVSLEYVAGVVDSEAHVGPVWYRVPGRLHPGIRLVTSISQNHRPMLEAIEARLGANGGIYNVKRNASQNRPCFTLNYNGIHALMALAQVYPHLLRKKQQAAMMLKLFIDGRLWAHVGAAGVHPEIRRRRNKLFKKLIKML